MSYWTSDQENAFWALIKWFKKRERKPLHSMTWTCEVCGRHRHDQKIDVLTYPLKDFSGCVRNLKHCNDSPKCIETAKAKALTGKS